MSSRREFFRQVLGEMCVVVDESRGHPHFQLAELGDLPDQALAELIPAITPGVEISLTSAGIGSRRPGEAETVILDFDPADLALFNHFNGERSIGRISSELAPTLDCDEQEVFARAKRVFLSLVSRGICIPLNQPLR